MVLYSDYDEKTSTSRHDIDRVAKMAAIREMAEHDDRDSARIQSQLAFMEDQIQKTQALFGELVINLEPILMPELDGPMLATDGPPSHKRSSEMSEKIDDLNSRLSHLQRGIGGVIERVQL